MKNTGIYILLVCVVVLIAGGIFYVKNTNTLSQGEGTTVVNTLGEASQNDITSPEQENNILPEEVEIDTLVLNEDVSDEEKAKYLNEIPKMSLFGDLLLLKAVLDEDAEILKIFTDEDLTIDILNGVVFNREVTNQEVSQVAACLKESVQYTGDDEDLQALCEGKNLYIAGDDFNAFHEKDFLTNMSLAYNNKDFNCNYIFDKNYDYPANILARITVKDYFSCEYIKDSSYPIEAKYASFYTAINTSCNTIKDDSNLVTLCKSVSLK